ncbi:MAG: hypothetical protein N2V72_00510 [Methanophagales archaeon]|nr:hypothetical protein [Methanophagales archaeon]
MPIELEEKEKEITVRARRGSAIIGDGGRKITVIGVWSGKELKELVDVVERVRKRHLVVERED